MPGTTKEENRPQRTRTIVVTTVVLLVLAGLGAFAWRVAYFADRIRRGEQVQIDLRFAKRTTRAQVLPAVAGTMTAVQVASADDPQLGTEGAPITIVEFADFACPFSQEAGRTMRILAAKYPERINYIYRDWPVTELHADAARAAAAGACAHKQGKFWEYHDKLYLNQNDLSEARLIGYAREANLNTEAFTRCLKSGEFTAEVAADFAEGAQAGVTGTPTFFINGTMIPGAIPEEILESIIVNWTKE